MDLDRRWTLEASHNIMSFCGGSGIDRWRALLCSDSDCIVHNWKWTSPARDLHFAAETEAAAGRVVRCRPLLLLRLKCSIFFGAIEIYDFLTAPICRLAFDCLPRFSCSSSSSSPVELNWIRGSVCKSVMEDFLVVWLGNGTDSKFRAHQSADTKKHLQDKVRLLNYQQEAEMEEVPLKYLGTNRCEEIHLGSITMPTVTTTTLSSH